MRWGKARGVLLAGTLALAACGGSASAGAGSAADPSLALEARAGTADWTRFDYDAARSGVGPADTAINAGNVRSLSRRRLHLDGTVDSSPIELQGVRVAGRSRDVIFITTTYGRTEAVDAASGQRLWEFAPAGIRRLEGTYQITTTTPLGDPSRRYVFAASPDGYIHKLRVSDGRQIRSGHWPVRVTLDATREKLAAALNLSGRELIATTGGYVGDAPTYQGHVVTIDTGSGRILHVWNSLCSDRHRLITPRSCPESDSAMWSRSGAAVEPGSGRLLVATGNASGSAASFDGRRYWGDSALELAPDASTLRQNWTPPDEASLSASDTDIGSTSPAILPVYGGRRLAVQGGKDGKLRLLDLTRMNGTRRAGPHLGGELQDIGTPGGDEVLTTPAVWTRSGTAYVFVADNSGTTVYVLGGGGRRPRLRVAAANATPGTSPILAGGLLYVYDQRRGAVNVYTALGLHRLARLPAAGGHWNSPIVLGGRVIVPEGDSNDHATYGTLDIFHLPGR